MSRQSDRWFTARPDDDTLLPGSDVRRAGKEADASEFIDSCAQSRSQNIRAADRRLLKYCHQVSRLKALVKKHLRLLRMPRLKRADVANFCFVDSDGVCRAALNWFALIHLA